MATDKMTIDKMTTIYEHKLNEMNSIKMEVSGRNIQLSYKISPEN